MVNAIEKIEVPQPAYTFSPAKIKMSEIRHMIIICPATMFAKRRMINAIGLMNKLNTSTGTKMNLIPKGIPGGLKI